MDSYHVKKSEFTVVDLLGIRRVVKRSGGSTLRYSIAHEQEAYSPTVLVAWQGRYTSPDYRDWQRPCETRAEFIERFELSANWK